MKTKTAMQELLKYIADNFNVKYPVGCDKKVAELLAKEKQDIIEAVLHGNRQDYYDGTETIGLDYFTQKYEQH